MSTQSTDSIDLTTLDLGHARHWADDPPYALFRRLRNEAPVHWSPNERWPDEGGFWSITRHEDLRTVTRDFETFSSEKRGIMLVDDVGVPLAVQQQQMISMDPPRHDRLKKIVGKAFTPKRVALHEAAMRKIISDVFDRVDEAGDSCDLVTQVARPIPARVIGSLLGTPPEDDHKLVLWTNMFTAFEEQELNDEIDVSSQQMYLDMFEYVVALKTARQEDPQDDLMSALVHAEVDGDRLNDIEVALFFGLLMAAGNDSTGATYGSTMLALLRDREQFEMARDKPELVPAVVEEGLRCFPAFGYFARAATRDVELEGQQIKEGDKLALWYISGNRDETVFDDPERFDLTRHDLGDHIAFGAGGRHFCLGAGLARLELKLWIEETLRRYPEMRLDGAPRRVQSMIMNQQFSIPVSLRG
ncbi:cytochrome P450 [Conexibacter sp. W3-3-2]|uniref:cytochrome P450 n=1 Tax=Conexibacter sp. W3-3-2 TaxID=2675227 RepID=UPI001328FF16|nr:cytochrome P450 [Conexibacter sp. W3-3-2]MTD43742.1 cytochrome P450 [Conexibacter sp. W3-3-2]